ncbi:MAG: phosphoribosylformylglycinamidine cyclo-ligase [Defluviitaleaceae bacterium]|nr:phosphoribosylformylglycinamidine cyclo-ligase [Defluviitaleaceae bacterium]
MSKAYAEAGVNIEAGYEAVNRMKAHVAKTARTGLMGSLGGFGGMFDLSQLGLKAPVLVSGTDGVGTKLKIAFQLGIHDTIGIDAVAMCVNDIIVQGAEPLFFLDYIATSSINPAVIEAIVKGLSEGCVQAGCTIVGGETAEMPGMYQDGEYDIAGFAVGAVEKTDIITGEGIQPGDVLVGIASSGAHSNGFSLIRRIIEKNGLELDKIYFGGRSLGETLLTPTKIYVKPILAAMKQLKIKGMSHITGGGFIENIPRMLPTGLAAAVKKGSWQIPEIFAFLQEKGDIPEAELYNVFNMGIGMVLAIAPASAAQLVEILKTHGETASIIGEVTTGEGLIWA